MIFSNCTINILIQISQARLHPSHPEFCLVLTMYDIWLENAYRGIDKIWKLKMPIVRKVLIENVLDLKH